MLNRQAIRNKFHEVFEETEFNNSEFWKLANDIDRAKLEDILDHASEYDFGKLVTEQISNFWKSRATTEIFENCDIDTKLGDIGSFYRYKEWEGFVRQAVKHTSELNDAISDRITELFDDINPWHMDNEIDIYFLDLRSKLIKYFKENSINPDSIKVNSILFTSETRNRIRSKLFEADLQRFDNYQHSIAIRIFDSIKGAK